MRKLSLLIAGGLLAATSLAAAVPAQAATGSDGLTAMSDFVSAFWDPTTDYFYTNSNQQIETAHAYGPDSGLYADFWWEAQNWETVMDAYQAAEARSSSQASTYRSMIDEVYDGFTAFYPTFSTDFNDDLAWWDVASIRAYQITGESRYLTTAENLFSEIWAYQDSTYGGGIWWQRSVQNEKNVAANAPVAEAAAQIYQATGDSSYLTDAESIFSWVQSTLQSGGHVYDHIDGSGLAKWDFTYNFGSYIGAADALYEATDTSSYLTDAVSAATWATTYLTNAGTVDYEGVDDAGGFKMILIRNLAHLVTAEGESQFLPYLQRNANQAWDVRRGSDGLIGADWSAPTSSSYIQSLTAAAGASALLVVPADGSTGAQPAFGTYDAINALTNVSTESTNAGFQGRGYLAGWDSDGQYVTFEVNAPSTANYELDFFYAAGAGAATRQITVNGTTLAQAESFPGTSSWTSWSTIRLNGVALNQGYNTVTVNYSAAAGDTNYLNLDTMEASVQLLAQNGVLHGLSTESTYSGYSGTAYVAGWDADSEWVDLNADVSRTGTYSVTLRYAAAAGNASRYLYVNGAAVVDDLSLPGTASWSTWNTVTVSGVALNAGSNTISVIYDSSLGSANYVNLDEVTVQYTGG